jgi:hypothetical protein
MIKKTNSFARALAIAEVLMGDEEVMFNKKLWYLDAYQNGREQGITLWDGGKICYYIAEHRNSDQIVIYKGSYAMQSLSDDAYKSPTGFSHVEDAVKWLKEEIK